MLFSIWLGYLMRVNRALLTTVKTATSASSTEEMTWGQDAHETKSEDRRA